MTYDHQLLQYGPIVKAIIQTTLLIIDRHLTGVDIGARRKKRGGMHYDNANATTECKLHELLAQANDDNPEPPP